MTGDIRAHDDLCAEYAAFVAWSPDQPVSVLRDITAALLVAAIRCGYNYHTDLIDWARARVETYKGSFN